MNIKGIPEEPSAEKIGQLGPVSRGKPPLSTVLRATDDQEDTSILSKMMAKTAKDLRSEVGVRSEKIARFKATLDEPLSLSDRQIDTIFRRMLES